MIHSSGHTKRLRILFLFFSEFINKFYGFLLAIVLPFKFGIETFGRIQFLIFCLSGLGGIVAANTRTIFTSRRSEFFIKYRLRNYFYSVSILTAISLFVVYWGLLCLYVALNNSAPGRSISPLELRSIDFIILFIWAEALLLNSNLSGALFSIHKIAQVGILNFLRVVIMLFGVAVSKDVVGIVYTLVISDIAFLFFGIKLFHSCLYETQPGFRKSLLFRLLKNRSNHLLLFGNASILIGLWYFQIVISRGSNGAENLGVYGLIGKYISLVSIIPGVFLQSFLVLKAVDRKNQRSTFAIFRNLKFLFVYGLLGNLVLVYGLSYSFNVLNGMSKLQFIIVLQFLSFSVLMNSRVSTESASIGNYRALAISDIYLGIFLLILIFFSSLFSVNFIGCLLILSCCYFFSSIYLLAKLGIENVQR